MAPSTKTANSDRPRDARGRFKRTALAHGSNGSVRAQEIDSLAGLADVIANKGRAFTYITSLTAGTDNRFPSIMDPDTRGNPRSWLRDVSAEKSNAVAHGFLYVQNRSLYDLYDEMMHKDVTLSRTLRLATAHILRRDQNFISPTPGDKRADEITAWIETTLNECRSNFGWCSFLETALLGAMQHGFSATEIVKDEPHFIATKEVIPLAFMHRHPGMFAFDDLGGLHLLGPDLLVSKAEPVDYGRFAFMRMPSLYGNPYGLSLLDDLAALYWFKKEVMKSLLYFTETYGTPLILIRPGPEFTDEQGDASETMTRLQLAIENMSREHGLLLTKGEDVTIEDRSGGMKGDLHQNVIKWITQEQVKYFMGGLLASEEAEFGTRAQASVHGHTTNIRLANIADLVSEMVTRDVITPLVRWNFGSDAPVPTFRISIEEPADIEKFLATVSHSLDHAVDVTEKQYRAVTGLDQPEDKEEAVLSPKALPSPSINLGGFPRAAEEKEGEDLETFRFRSKRKKKLSQL